MIKVVEADGRGLVQEGHDREVMHSTTGAVRAPGCTSRTRMCNRVAVLLSCALLTSVSAAAELSRDL